MEVTGQLHAAAVLTPGKCPRYQFSAGLAPRAGLDTLSSAVALFPGDQLFTRAPLKNLKLFSVLVILTVTNSTKQSPSY